MKRSNYPHQKLLFVLAASIAWTLNPTSLFAGITSSWNSDVAANWNDGTKWDNGVPGTNGASGDIANLTFDISVNRTIALTNNLTLATLNIGDPSGNARYMPSMGAGSYGITFNNSGAGALLQKPYGLATGNGDEMDCNIALADNLTVSNSGPIIFWKFPITGAAGNVLTKLGPGMLSVDYRGNNTFGGGTIIAGGLFQIGPTAPSAGTYAPFGSGSVTISNGATVLLCKTGGTSNHILTTNNYIFGAGGGAIYGYEGNNHLTGPITISQDASFGSSFGGKAIYLDGPISGSANITCRVNTNYSSGNTYNGSFVYVTNDASSSYSGTVTVTAMATGNGSYLFIGGTNALSGATINLGGNNSVGNGVTGVNNFANTLQFTVASARIGALSGTGGFSLTKTDGSTAVALTISNNASTTTLSGGISGGGSITKLGNSAQTLSGANSYTGTTVVSAGKLALGAASTITNTITAADGTTLGVVASGVSQLAPVTLTLGSSTGCTNEFSGLASTTVAPLKPGTLVVNGPCKISIVSGSFAVGSSYPLITNSSVRSITFSLASQPQGVNGTLSVSGNTLYYNVTSMTPKIWSGATDANWNLTTANWTFNSAPATYQDNNTVQFDDTGANTSINIPSAVSPGSVTVNNSAQPYSFAGAAITGGTGLTKTGNGTLTLNNTNTFTGGVTVNGGTLNVNANNAYSGGTVVNSGGTLAFNVGGQSGAIRGTLSINSGGYANCTVANALGYGVGTRVETVNVSGGLLETTVSGDVNWNTTFNLTGGELRANGGTSSSGPQWITLGRDTTGSCGVNTFASANSSVISGCLRLRNDQGQTNVTFNVADGAAAVDLLVSAAITYNSGNVGITKTGAGTMDLTGQNTYTGPTIVNGGTLLVDGFLAAGAVTVTNANLGGYGIISGPVTIGDNSTLSLGASIGTLTINNSLAMAATDTNIIKLNKSGSTLTNDQIVSTSVTLGGTLIVQASGDPLAAGDSFLIYKSSGTYSGNFATTNLPATPAGTKWNLSALNSSGIISVMLVNAVSTPVFTPPAGGYIGAQTVTISSDAGSTIYYTTNGSTPTTSSPSGLSPVTVTIPVNTNMTLQAFAKKATYADSPVASASYSTLDRGIWITAGNGSWGTSANWSNGIVPNASGVIADFSTLALGAPPTNTLDGARTVGQLWLDDVNDTFAWDLSTTGPLTLDNGAGKPVVFVGHSATYSSSLSCAVAGTNGFVKAGPGNLTLANNGNTFTGDLLVTNGTLTLSIGTSSGSTSSALGAKVGGRNVVVKTLANWAVNNLLGAGGMNASNLPTLVVYGTNTAARWNPLGNVVLNGGTLDQSVSDSGNYEGWQLLGSVSVAGSAPSYVTTGNGKADHLLYSGNTFDVADVTGDAQSDLIVSAPLRNSSGDYAPTTSGSLFKTGTGTLELAAANTYTGNTVITNGTLLVTGSINTNGTVTVIGGALSGTGTIYSPVTVQSGGTLKPGTSSAIGTLTVSGASLTLGGNAVFRITKDGGAPCDVASVSGGSVGYGGTLTVTNIGTTALANGDSFQLFQAGSYAGTWFTTYNLPALSGGLSWDKSQLNVNGTISVVNTTATPLFSPVGGNYFTTLAVTITGDTGSTIHYSINGGGTWSTAASPATVNIGMSASVTILAYASKAGFADSPQTSASYTTQPEAVWTSTVDGSWATAGNWLNSAIGNGSGVTANFNTLTMTADTTVTLDSTPVIGNLKFGDVGGLHNWNITGGTGGPLTLDSGAVMPTITVSNMTTTFTNVLAGTNGLVKKGAGTLALENINTYTGGTVVSNGTLVLNNGGGSGAVRGTLTIASGATVNLAIPDALGYNNDGTCVSTVTINGGTLTNGTTGNQGFRTSFILAGGTMATAGGSYNLSPGFSISSLASSTKSSINSAIQLRSGSNLRIDTAAGTVPNGTDLEITDNIFQNGAGQSVTKTGTGTLVLSGGGNNYNSTIVSNGTLLVNGTLSNSGGVTNYGGTVGGSGTINGPVAINSGATIAPGTSSIGKLTVNGDLTLAGTAAFRLNKSGSVLTNDQVAGLTSVTYGGTLTVTATGTLLASGDSFTLFSGGTRSGSFAATNLPALSSGLGWQWNPTAGTLAVIQTVNLTPTNITFTANGNQLTLSWPADHTGWTLQSQTNNINTGLTANGWSDVAGSAATNQVIINTDPTKPTVFYRMYHP